MHVVMGLLGHYRDHRRPILVVGCLSIVSALLEAAVLVAIVPLAEAITEGDTRISTSWGGLDLDFSIQGMIVVALVAVVLASISQVLTARVRARAATRFLKELRLRLWDAYFNASWDLQAAEPAGRVLELSGNMAASGSQGLVQLANLMSAAASVVIFLLVALMIDPRAAAAVLVMAVVLSSLLRPLSKRVREMSRAAAPHNIARSSMLSEQVGFARELRLFQATPAARADQEVHVATVATLQERSQFLSTALSPLYRGAGFILLLGALSLAASWNDADLTTIGAIVLLLIRSFSYGQQLQVAYQALNQLAPLVDVVTEQLEVYEHAAEPTGTTPLDRIEEITFSHVAYRYPSGVQGLSDADFTLRRGERVGVVGPSGSGKSTLAQIVLRLRSPTEGRARVNGVDTAEYDPHDWFARVALVPQETALFNGTVTENIAFHRPLDQHAVEDAARAAGLHDTIAGLPLGYDTIVGPVTQDLSGGQVQRIGIARALAGRPDLLVLDEPTSALDVHAEAVVQETLEALGDDVILVIIAHRLSTLTICDRLFLVNDGRIEADGPPAEVLATSAFFSDPAHRAQLDLA